ncbi:MAG: hypothetical protein K6A68_08515 [Clostridiales bacterium]|nr:hypothetical protein [Clostridiales bacterium]
MMNFLPVDEERSFSFTVRRTRKRKELEKELQNSEASVPLFYNEMRTEIRAIPFGDYLKRYIYVNSSMNGHFSEIPVKEYMRTIMDAFRENGVPASMENPDIRLATVTRRWLEQYSVGRETVLLLGFGLGMMPEEVDLFLMEALHDHRMHPDDPLEGICQYCFEHRYGWEKMQQLRDQLEKGQEGLEERLMRTQPADRLQSRRTIREDLELLTGLFRAEQEPAALRKTREWFGKLYASAGKKIVLESSGAIQREVTQADVERVFCPPVQKDRYGNLRISLQPGVKRELGDKRFTRLHQHLLLSGKKEPERYDLLTLGFYLQTGAEMCPDPAKRSEQFRHFMNPILEECGYGPVYEADPYECYLLIALASADPMETYNNVMEMALDRQGDGD